MSEATEQVTPLSSQNAVNIANHSRPNWLSRVGRSSAKSVLRSGRTTPYCRHSMLNTRRLHGQRLSSLLDC